LSIDVWIVERKPKDKGFLLQPERRVAEINRTRRMQVVAATPTAPPKHRSPPSSWSDDPADAA